jgi:hypothetical protein
MAEHGDHKNHTAHSTGAPVEGPKIDPVCGMTVRSEPPPDRLFQEARDLGVARVAPRAITGAGATFER